MRYDVFGLVDCAMDEGVSDCFFIFLLTAKILMVDTPKIRDFNSTSNPFGEIIIINGRTAHLIIGSWFCCRCCMSRVLVMQR